MKNKTKNWDCSETSTPISDIRNLILKCREVNGENYENAAICMSEETFIKCFNSKEEIHYAGYSSGNNTSEK